MKELLASTSAAWFVLVGVVLGLLIAAGAAAWLTRLIGKVIREAKDVVKEMKAVIGEARAIARFAASEYRPLADRITELENWRKSVERSWRAGTGDPGGGG